MSSPAFAFIHLPQVTEVGAKNSFKPRPLRALPSVIGWALTLTGTWAAADSWSIMFTPALHHVDEGMAGLIILIPLAVALLASGIWLVLRNSAHRARSFAAIACLQAVWFLWFWIRQLQQGG
jgi:hypothetical protein